MHPLFKACSAQRLDRYETGLPAEDGADEAANAYEMCPHPFSVACDDTLCDLAHKANVVVEQASVAGSMRACRSICIEVQGFNVRRSLRRARRHGTARPGSSHRGRKVHF